MNIFKFFKSELYDRLRFEKRHFTFGWNIIFFPWTLTQNYIVYRKWIETLEQINCSIDDISDLKSVTLLQDKVPFLKQLESIGIGPNPSHFNCCHFVIRDELFLFPINSPFHKRNNEKQSFFTEYLPPIVISLTNSIHPYETKWKLDTFINIERIVYDENKTKIYMKGRINDEGILLIIDEKITFTNNSHKI
ncbi:MAG: hypothetical protein JXQ87_19015 [Bacteroidia bacterium]